MSWKNKRKTRMVLRALPCILVMCLISAGLSMLIVPFGGWKGFIAGFAIGAVISYMGASVTADWVLAPLDERDELGGRS